MATVLKKKKRKPARRQSGPELTWEIVLVLKSRQKIYAEFGTFRKGEQAASKLLVGFSVDVKVALSQKP